MRLILSVVLAALTVSCGGDDSSSTPTTDPGDGGALGSDGGGSSMSDGTAEQLCIDSINGYRKTLGLTPFTRWNAEEPCADGQAKSDSAGGTAHGAFGMCGENAQNECPGWPGPASDMIPKCLMQMWGEGPGSDFSKHGHYLNMSSTKYTMVSCGFYALPDGKVWAVQDFR
ncbi:MAG: CAP domain-containing protein [Polyangiaceae bacterium]